MRRRALTCHFRETEVRRIPALPGTLGFGAQQARAQMDRFMVSAPQHQPTLAAKMRIAVDSAECFIGISDDWPGSMQRPMRLGVMFNLFADGGLSRVGSPSGLRRV